MRIALYSHDSFGLGHLRRCLKLASALAARFTHVEGLIVTGSPWSRLFQPPRGFRYRQLMPVTKTGPGRYEARQVRVPFGHALAARTAAISNALRDFRPDLLLVDNVPCGLAGELLPALEASDVRTRTVLVLRDVLDAPDAIHEQWSAAGAFEAVDTHYDEVWVFGDPDSSDPFHRSLSESSQTEVVFCGLLGSAGSRAIEPGARRLAHRQRPVVVVTGGGGGDAAEMIDAYARALRTSESPPESRIVLGPDFPLPIPRFDFGGAPTSVTRFCSDLPALLSEADAVVSMAGYNTTCEILDAGVPAVLVPRVWPRQEQWLRARALADAGRVQCLPLEGLSPDSLWQAVESALSEKRRPARSSGGGGIAAQRAARLLDLDIVAA